MRSWGWSAPTAPASRRCCGSARRLLTPTSGVVRLNGADIATQPREARRSTGLLLADDRALYWRLSGLENLRFFGVMAGLTPRAARDRAADLLEEMGLSERDRLVFGYSSGMRVRLSLARTLIADPPLIILDEPTRSLDPAASADLLRRIRGLRERGRAVLLSTHRLDEVEAVGDRVLAVAEGQQVLYDTVENLRTEQQTPTQVLKDLLGAQAGT